MASKPLRSSARQRTNVGQRAQRRTTGTNSREGGPDVSKIPKAFICPITHCLMKRPVMVPEGQSFERSYIERWLQKKPTNPCTQNPLGVDQLIPNLGLQNLIEDFLEDHPEYATADTPRNQAAADSSFNSLLEESKESKAEEVPLPAFNVDKGLPVSVVELLDVPAGGPNLPNAAPVKEGFTRKRLQLSLEALETPQTRSAPTPCDVVIVIDTSGSMCTAAVATDAKGNTEDDGLSVLDVVKHAVNTIIAGLGEKDRCAVIEYNNKATIVQSLTPMNYESGQRAMKLVANLQPRGSTNLWDGLLKAFNELQRGHDKTRHQSIMLLTDGCPNILPPTGIIPEMKNFLSKNPLQCCVHTFGFGYSMDSPLLTQIATEGNGMYSFIPDAGMVGTVFVNALANIASTYARNVTVRFEIDGTATVQSAGDTNPASRLGSVKKRSALASFGRVEVVRDALWQLHRTTVTPSGIEVAVGSLNFGQKRTVALHLDIPAGLEKDTYIPVSTIISLDVVNRGTLRGPQRFVAETKSLTAHADAAEASTNPIIARAILVHAVDKAVKYCRKDSTKAQGFIEAGIAMLGREAGRATSLIKGTSPPGDVKAEVDTITGIAADLEGQCKMGFDNESYAEKWARHYAPSLGFAHRVQRCNNFKDPGVQFYGGDLFNSVKVVADKNFRELPPPTASRLDQLKKKTGQKYQAPPPPTNMAKYYNCSGGCIAGDCLAVLADGTNKAVGSLRPGDLVLTSTHQGAPIARVAVMVETLVRHGLMEMSVFPSGLQATPYHPVRANMSKWQFPADSAESVNKVVACDKVYSFVLESVDQTGGREVSMVVNGYDCAALAHGVTNDDVLRHEFLGTERVVESLQRCAGWDEGVVRLNQYDFLRDSSTHQIVEIQQTA